MNGKNSRIKTGWAKADITPEQNVFLAGQFHARVSEGIMDPVTATALAFESPDRQGLQKQAVMVSCDLASISNELRDAVRRRIKSETNELDPENIFIGATHTHSAPDARMMPYGMEQYGSRYKSDISPQAKPSLGDKYGMWPYLKLDVMSPADYLEFAADLIAQAVAQAWKNREISGIAYGLGHAVIGHNRRLAYKDGTSRMYGSAGISEFSHVEGYEDHSVYAMMIYNRDKNLSGIVVNVPCPSQVSEHIYMISADYWHETRMELRKRFGEKIFILAQCAPAGDQSPHLLIGKRAEERMWRLKRRQQDQNAPREEIAQKIADAISDIIPYAEKEIEWHPELEHRREIIELPRRMVSEKDVEKALEESRPFKEKYEKLAAEIEENPEIMKQPRWYTEITKAYRLMERGERVQKRAELQKKYPNMPIEVHAVRIGETTFATNPFELYLDYAVRIRELSAATQTFLVQKAGCNGTYLPSERSISGGGYGSVPASTDIGPEGGEKLVEWTVSAINSMFVKS